MGIETFRAYCLSLPGTTEGMKWGHALTARDGIQQAYHLAKRQWVQIANLEVLNDANLKKRVAKSRALVLAKLPKKVQEKYVATT